MSAILVVEDTSIIREPMTRLLRSEGFEVAGAANGIEALQILQKRQIDLVLLDVMMPRMSGIALLEKMRSHETWRSIPVIGMTGVLDTGRLARLRELGVQSIIAKGVFTFDAMLKVIQAHLPAHHHV